MMSWQSKFMLSTVALGMALFAQTSLAKDAVVKNNHLEVNGKKYFRVGSEDIELGSYGEKKSPLLQGNYLEPHSHIPFGKLKVKQAVIVEIDFQKSTKADILANISLAGVFKGNSSNGYEDLKQGRLKLVKFIVENNAIRDAANGSKKVLDNLISYGNDARMVSQVFVVLEASMAKAFVASKDLKLKVNAGIASVEVGGGIKKKGATSVKFSPGSIFAYGLVKLDWDSKKKKKKSRIVKVTDDQWGPN